MKALAILIDPKGDEWFVAYGPKTKNRRKASRFQNAAIATKVAADCIFGSSDAFWNSERESARLTREEHRGWSYRVEEVEDSDMRTRGYTVALYASGTTAYSYATPSGMSDDEDAATLFPTWEEARAFADTIPKPEGYNIAISSF